MEPPDLGRAVLDGCERLAETIGATVLVIVARQDSDGQWRCALSLPRDAELAAKMVRAATLELADRKR